MLAISFVLISQETKAVEHVVLWHALGYGADVLFDLCNPLCKLSTLYVVIPRWIASGSDPVLQLCKNISLLYATLSVHSTFKELWNTLPAVWNIKDKLTDISLVFGLYSDVIRMYWALCVDCTLKKYISSYISKVHKSKNWIFLGNAWSENCLHQSSDFSKTEFPWYVWHVKKTCPDGILICFILQWIGTSPCAKSFVHHGVDGNHESRIPYLIN